MPDPGLVADLAAVDGSTEVPIDPRIMAAMNRSCRRYLAGTILNQVFTSSGSGSTTVMIIHPSALPPGAGVAINPPVQPTLRVAVGLVHTSRQCTGT